MLPDLSRVSTISIYIHIPFCLKKCRYCDFYSLTSKSPSTKNHIIDEILRQLVWFMEQLGYPRVATVYIGGGTPNSLEIRQAAHLFDSISKIVLPHAQETTPFEWTVEVNPESLSEEFLIMAAQNGVTRLSIGIQTFSERHFEVIGRVGSPRLNHKALDLVRRNWPNDLSVDIITALPDEGPAEAKKDINTALRYQPDHVSLYALTIEEKTPLYEDVTEGRIVPLSSEQAESIWLLQIEMLQAHGYDRYEVSNFAQRGKKSMHNLTYWQLSPYCGCGPASVSTLPSFTGPLRLITTKKIGNYLRGLDSVWGMAIEHLGPQDFLIEHLMMGLRLVEGINVRRIRSIFGIDIQEIAPRTIEKWMRQRLLMIKNEQFMMSQKGLNLLDGFLYDFVAEIGSTKPVRAEWPQMGIT